MKNSPVYNIPASQSFTRILAEWVLEQYGEAPEALSRVIIFLPSRRSVRALQEAFLDISGGAALLLPQMEGLGDIELPFLLRHASLTAEQIEMLQSLPPAAADMQRLRYLSELIWQFRQSGQVSLSQRSQAVELAASLAELMDEMQREQCEWELLDSMVPDEYAEHWQHTLQFLQIIRQYWPQAMQDMGLCDPWQRRNQLTCLLAKSWAKAPPQGPVIAAGSTGSVPASAALMRVITNLPQGHLFLPGLDTSLSGEWAECLPESHPQCGLYRLLEKVHMQAVDVPRLPSERQNEAVATKKPGHDRQRWISAAFLPPEATVSWQSCRFDAPRALKDCYLVECEYPQQEAIAIALLLRETQEEEGKTAALVTPNRKLARQVRNQLRRWKIDIDDSAGEPLRATAPAIFLELIYQLVLSRFSPVALLSLLQHPLCRLEREPAEIRPLARSLELAALRGLQPDGIEGIRARLASKPAIADFFEEVVRAVQPLMTLAQAESVHFTELLQAHLSVAERLSQDSESRALIWQGEAAAQLAELMADLKAHMVDFPAIDPEDYGNLLAAFMRPQKFRSKWGSHPRLKILSPMEARLQQYDRVVIADVNEGSWPAQDNGDPWLNRPMRGEMKLPLPERKKGLMAHDFCQLLSGPEVFLTRSQKVEGTITVSSPFLLRLQAVLEIVGGEEALHQWSSHPVGHWVGALDNAKAAQPLTPPEPKPPVAARPRQLSVTRIERLMRDPYSIYAQKILRLDAKDPLEQSPGPAEFGNAVHDALEKWHNNGASGLAALLEAGKAAFAKYQPALIVDALWWPRFRSIAEWLMAQSFTGDSLAEQKGKWHFDLPGGEFTLEARTDRLDFMAEGLRVIDYKTGTPPAAKDMKLGLANQLLLTALIARKGGYGARAAALPIAALEYWQLSGGRESGKIIPVPMPEGLSFEEMLADAEANILALLRRFDDVSTPYLPCPDWQYRPRYNDYEHLARLKEWASG